MACGGNDDASSGDVSGSERPGGGSRDAGSDAGSGGSSGDAGTRTDAGSGSSPDAGTRADAGTGQDAGTPPPAGQDGGVQPFGKVYSGKLYLGPVEWTGSFPNACSPYPAQVQQDMGELLVGLSNAIPDTATLCDACVFITTAAGRKAVGRVVTYGDTTGEGYLDTSRALYTQLTQGDSNPTPNITWQVAKCPEGLPMRYQFQSGSHQDWTSFWVRNSRLPISKVEVKSSKNTSWQALRRETDGTFNDDDGIGLGAFSIRVTAVDGQQHVDDFPSYTAGAQVLTGQGNFQ
jgi:expansin